MSLPNLLSVGLACVAAAFLVAPLIDSTVPDCQTILATLGTTVLEAAAWAMAASAARQSRKTFVAAAFARICVAFSHLLDALIARSMLVLSNADASAIQAGSLVVSVYFMVALFLGRASTEAATSEHAIAAGNARDIPGGNIRDGQQQATKEHTRMSVTLEVSQLEYSIEASAEQPAKLQKKMSETMHGNQQSSW